MPTPTLNNTIRDIRITAAMDFPNNVQQHLQSLLDLETQITESLRPLYDETLKTLRAMEIQRKNQDRVVFQYTLEIDGVLAFVFELEEGKFYFKAPGDKRIFLGEPVNTYDCYNMMGRLTQSLSNAIQEMKDAHG